MKTIDKEQCKVSLVFINCKNVVGYGYSFLLSISFLFFLFYFFSKRNKRRKGLRKEEGKESIKIQVLITNNCLL